MKESVEKGLVFASFDLLTMAVLAEVPCLLPLSSKSTLGEWSYS